MSPLTSNNQPSSNQGYLSESTKMGIYTVSTLALAGASLVCPAAGLARAALTISAVALCMTEFSAVDHI